MNATETAKLCAAIAQSAPAQKFDDDTPAFWAVLLADVRYEDAREAVVTLLKRQPFVAPADILERVRTIRADRLSRVEMPTPNVDPDETEAYNAEVAAIRTAIADGQFDAATYVASGLALSGRPAVKAIGDGSKPASLEGRISLHPDRLAAVTRRPERPLPVDYGDRPVVYVPPVPPEEITRREAEKTRQIAALAATYGPQVTEPAEVTHDLA